MKNNFSEWKEGVWGYTYFLGSSSSRQLMVLCAGSSLVISVEQNDFYGDRRIVGQSNAEACSQISCSPGDWPGDVVQKLAGINQHHVWSTWSHDRDTERLDEHGLVTLPQAAILIDQGRRDWTQFKLEDIGYINAALLPHD